jgi:hypothetical protein
VEIVSNQAKTDIIARLYHIAERLAESGEKNDWQSIERLDIALRQTAIEVFETLRFDHPASSDAFSALQYALEMVKGMAEAKGREYAELRRRDAKNSALRLVYSSGGRNNV